MSSAKNRASDFFSRVRQARRAKGLSQGELASEIGCSQDTISDLERGKSKGSDALRKSLAAALAVNEEWLVNGQGDMRAAEGHAPYGRAVEPGIPNDLPIVGRARGGRGEFSHDGFPVGEGWRRVRRPYDVKDKNAFAVEVVGDSMAPRYEAGDVVVCSPAKSWRSGDYCVVMTHDDEALVKRVTTKDGVLVLSSIAPGVEPLVLARKEVRSINKIVWKKEK